jgi:alkylhydroperoxidase family enzyme
MISLVPFEEAVRRGRDQGIDEFFTRVNAFRAMLHNPHAAGAAYRMLEALLKSGTVDPAARELVILRTGWRTGSEYEFCQHVRVARETGIAEEKILGVRDPESCRAFSETERALLRMVDELFDRSEVSSQTLAILRRAFTDSDLIELLMIAGFWRTIAGILKTGKVPLDDGVAGWPEGRGPG